LGNTTSTARLLKDSSDGEADLLPGVRKQKIGDRVSDDRPRVFYGWWVVLTAALGLCLGSASIMTFSFSVFLKPLSQEFHSGRGAISLAYTLFNLTTGISVLLAGRMVDRFGARKVIAVCAVMFAVILLSNRIVSGKISELYVFYVALGLFAPGMGPLPYSEVVSHWFDRHRGLALGLMMFGLGTGAMIMPSVAQRLIAMFGWRVGYVAYGLAVLLIPVPIVGVFLRERPEKMGLLPDGDAHIRTAKLDEGVRRPGLSWREARHGWTFWIMACAFCLSGASVQGCVVHMSAMLTDRGSTAQTAALASSVLGAALLIGRVGSGYLLDRLFATLVAAFFFGVAAIGIALLGISTTPLVAFVAAFLVGLGVGAEADLIAYMTSRYFGLRSFGEIYSYAWAAFVLSGALGVYLLGVGFDARGSYFLPLAAFLVATLAAVALITRLGPYRFCARSPNEFVPEQTTSCPES
jgi:MFS family permease